MVARVVWSQLCGSLKEVVDNAAQRWFWECLRQAKLGDAQNQMLVGAPFPLSVKNKTHTVSPCQGVTYEQLGAAVTAAAAVQAGGAVPAAHATPLAPLGKVGVPTGGPKLSLSTEQVKVRPSAPAAAAAACL